ncbi:probable glutathione S-transferase 7 [Paramacrobiotus metropolitanus]|uniref:probable glutathione S-transferase 7 n=1 Tax=Paramacrobiotus metropolitanus TaxID=2943436 RepID=UPI0024458CFB|nr:probable glutathione S-transferase 7 [Paramacrobiotus metropolitanus]
MPSYKVSYFDMKGRGELARLVLAAAGQKFEDNRLAKGDWGTMKPGTPYGQLPVLEVDGKMLGQSGAMVRYVARQHGLMGSGAWEEALIDSFNDAAMDVFQAAMKVIYGTEESQKAAEGKKFKDETVPGFFKIFDKYIQEHGKDGHVVGNKLSLADLALFNVVDQLITIQLTGADCAEQFPNVKKVVDTVKHDPKIDAYLKK